MGKKNAAIVAELTFAGTHYCLDFTCHAGHDSHLDHYASHDGAHVRCTHPGCDTAYRLGAEVLLQHAGTRDADPNEGRGRASLQWKGTNVTKLTYRCVCGSDNAVSGDFLYDVTCEGCGVTYRCNQNLKITALDAEERKSFETSGGTFVIAEPDILDQLDE